MLSEATGSNRSTADPHKAPGVVDRRGHAVCKAVELEQKANVIWLEI